MMTSDKNTIFKSDQSFCSECGTILPLFRDFGNVECYVCKQSYPIELLQHHKTSYTIHFNSIEKVKDTENPTNDGPLADRKCPKCGNNKMSYASLQLRSADEGQTIFYTCTKCQFKESENS